MEIEKIVKEIFDKILFILLSDNEYRLQHENILYLQSLRNSDIYTVDELSDSIIIKNLTGKDIAIYKIQKYCPQVIDSIPVLMDENFIELLPVIVVPNVCNLITEKWIIVHEICHLLSLGKYIINSDTIYHYFGINHYVYDKNMKLILQNINNRNNEILNDAITWYFLELLENQKIYPKNDFIKKHCGIIKERSDIKEIVGLYFSNQIELLMKKLKINY